MKIPKEIKIGAKTFKVEYVDNNDLRDNWADVHHMTQTIRINKDIHKECQEECLLHESLHIIFDMLKFEQKEDTIQPIACLMHQVVKQIIGVKIK